MTADQLAARLGVAIEVRMPGGELNAKCPAHDDGKASLALKVENGKPLLKCMAGCKTEAVLAACGVQWKDLLNGGQPKGAKPRIVATYDYHSADGGLLFQVVRYEPKAFRQRRPDGAGGWAWNLDGIEPVLYHLPVLLKAPPDARVLLVEGEKDVASLQAMGLLATTNPMGAGKWRPSYSEALGGRRVAILPDYDEAGREHARMVAAALHGVASGIKLVELPGLPPKGDVSDWLTSSPMGRTKDELVALLDATPEWRPPDPTQLLTRVEAHLRRYVVLPSEAAYVAVVLWVAHAHATGAAESTPRLAFLSPEPECGKTRALEVLETLVPRPMLAVNATPAAIFRAVENVRPTILFDEIDTVFGPKAKENEELRALLNAGHRRSGVAYRCVGEGTHQEVKPYPAYAAVALAGIGDLPDTLLSRSVIIQMRRRTNGEEVTPFRQREAEATGHQLRDDLAGWSALIGDRLMSARPEIPDGVTDRSADMWEPLLAIADAVSGEWAARARQACIELVRTKYEREPSLSLQLLADLRQVFGNEDVMPTQTIISKLMDLDEGPWLEYRGGRPLNDRGLAKLLRGYGVRSQDVRVGLNTFKGYRRDALYDAWKRYLPPPSAEGQQGQLQQPRGQIGLPPEEAVAFPRATFSGGTDAALSGSSVYEIDLTLDDGFGPVPAAFEDCAE